MNIGDAMQIGGVGMWVLLVYCGIVLPLVWGYGLVQLFSLIRWRRKVGELGRFASSKDAPGLVEHLDEKARKDVVAGVVAAAARSSLEGGKPEDVMGEAGAELEERLAAGTPARAAVAMISLALAVLAPLVLGTMFRCMRYVSYLTLIQEERPVLRCRLLEGGIQFADYPFWLGIVVAAILAVPALVAVFMELTALRAVRRRDDVLRLVEMLLGQSVRPATSTGPGVAAFVAAVVLTGAAGWVLCGPPVRNLAAPWLHGSCIHGLEGRSVRIPVSSGGVKPGEEGYKLIVSMGDILLEAQRFPVFSDGEDASYSIEDVRVTDLVEGKAGAALAADGVTIGPLVQVLEDTPPEGRDDCTLLHGCGPPTVEEVLAVIDEDVPLETVAAVLITARRSGDRSVNVLVRTGPPPAAPRLAGLLEAVKVLGFMKCILHCPYGQIAVEDLVAGSVGSGKPVLDGRAGGTFGDFIEGVDGPSFDVVVP